MADERVFLNEGTTYISNTKILMGGTTYATANITSVSKGMTPPSRGCALILMLMGAFCVLGALGIMTEKFGAGFVTLLFAAGIAAAGYFWFRSLKADYHVLLRSASGEAKGLTSKDEAAIDRVIVAISEAITHRG